MSYDLLALSVGANYEQDLCCADITAERLKGFGKVFNERYHFVGKMKGTWFETVKTSSLKILGSFDLCDFEFNNEHRRGRAIKKQTITAFSLNQRSFSDSSVSEGYTAIYVILFRISGRHYEAHFPI